MIKEEMGTLKKICLLLLLGSFFSKVHAQVEDITFRRVSPPGGYSFQAVHSFEQDRFGYIWMGSFDGVMKYNSREVVRFVHDPEDKDGLPSNRVSALVIDQQNQLWVSTEEGLCLFDHEQQEFKRVRYEYDNGEPASTALYSMELDGEGNLWIADDQFFGYLDQDKNQLVRITKGLDDQPRLLYYDDANRLWLGTSNGFVYEVLVNEKRVDQKIEGPGSLTRTICTIKDEIWVGYEAHGARRYDHNGTLIQHYSYPAQPRFDIQSASVRKILKDKNGQIWIGSYLGLFLSTAEGLIHFNHTDYDGIPHNSIYTIFEDDQGGIWIGTWSGGVSYLHDADNSFKNYQYSKAPGSISDNMVSSFAQMPSGELIVGTEQGGLNRFDIHSSTFSGVKPLDDEGVLNVKALCVDDDGGLWVACAFKGLYYRPAGEGSFIHFEEGIEDGNHISALGVYTLCKSESGIWIGTNFGGLNYYDFETKKISFKSDQHPFSDLYGINIRSLALDSRENLWISSTNGIHKIHLPTSQSTHFSVESNNSFGTRAQSYYFVTELSDGTIWMGTGGDAINIYDPETQELRYFDADGLLKGKDVYGVVEGISDQIWITSNEGLVLHHRLGKSSRKFVMIDGIQGNLFNPNAIFKDKDGNLFFGGTNGFSLLEPKNIRINTRPPNILINKILVNNRELVPKQRNINEFYRLVLSPKESTLTFDFSADNYLLPEKNQFKYRLANYVDDWIDDGNNGSATFVNIPPGEYIFEIKASNNDGVWQENPAHMLLIVNQFWYKSSLALALYSIIFLIVAVLIIQFYRERLRLKKALLVEKIKHEHEDELHEMKLRFFTNISHEFRTPLTLITWPIRDLLKSENLTADERGQLETVRKNTNRLLQLIGQIMEFRKLEKGQAKLNISKIELVSFVEDIILSFDGEAKSKNISFSFLYETDPCFIEADSEKLDKIIYNLLSNAFKFTPTNGKISVALQGNKTQNQHYFSNQLSFGKLDTDHYVEIVVIDNGRGIDSDDLPNIFNRFEQGKQQEGQRNSTGIGLNLCKDFTLMHRGVIVVQSTPGEGSRFSVRFPTRQKAQKILYESHEKVKNMQTWERMEKVQPLGENRDVTILIVEDNEDLSRYMIKFLRTYYMVKHAKNGKSALEVLASENIQLVISDVMMPEMDGFEFCQKVKSQIETSHIPVILLTALSSTENQSRGLEKGADAYLSKPFDENVLLSQVQNLLAQRKRLQDSYVKRFMSQKPIDIGSLDNYFLTKLNAIIDQNIENENFSVDQLAREIGFSRSQLHRKLKQITNSSTSSYISMLKIQRATQLLSTGQYNIDEVAHKSGFNSHSYFNKCFKKIHSKTPREFLMELRK